jgi:hypothetical protein
MDPNGLAKAKTTPHGGRLSKRLRRWLAKQLKT